MDIGTAKPSPTEQQGVPHHLIDILWPGEAFNVADFQRLARSTIADIAGRSHLPMVVGGTGLYISSLTQGYDLTGDEADWDLRRELEATAERDGDPALHARLATVDPVAAARIHPNDRRRIVRALEVTLRTGRPFSASSHRAVESDYAFLQVGLTAPREVIYERINRRVDAMLADGLIAETERLLDAGYEAALTAGQAIGYKELAGYFDGSVSLCEAVESIKLATRHYAKRQLTWFRRMEGVNWLYREDYDDNQVLLYKAAEIALKYKS
jgi:tRNA dimethylallyltransferase